MTAFAGDSIALTFSADLTQARAAYDQFIADVSRRPVPIQFQRKPERGNGTPSQWIVERAQKDKGSPP